MFQQLNEFKKFFNLELATSKTKVQLTTLKDQYLGRKKGKITLLMKDFKTVPASAKKKELGKALNQFKAEVSRALQDAEDMLKNQTLEQQLSENSIDITLPGNRRPLGHPHPLALVKQEIESIFHSLGYSIEDGPEIESTYYNFEALNIPENHPARDEGDTFYFSNDLLLRTHTSPVQIRTMEKKHPPLRIICSGTVYRRDNPDATHSPVFQQVEGLAVDEKITFRDFKGTMEFFLKSFFSKETLVRFRPSYFGFTEPSAELDISCRFCSGSGCRVCKMTGWIEAFGAGMVDPAVFGHVGIDPEQYNGFAFGIGVERFAMMKFGVDNILNFYQNDLRFLRQF